MIAPTNVSEEDQEKVLDRCLKKIKAKSFYIHTAIEKNNLRQCLKDTYSMLSELRTGSLTPKNYYHLFTAIFDEMMVVENFFKEEIERGRKPRDLYDSVQQALFLIPRLYLMISAGSILMEKEPKCASEIIFDLLGMIKGVQNPIRGLFVRYYLLKRIKDKLPDKDNIYIQEGGSMDDTFKLLLQNMDEMNRLWIRLSTDSQGNEKLLRDKERTELKILVGESLNRLSLLDGLTIEIYEKEVLPKLIETIIESNDALSQQYIMECIIHAFPDSYNIKCIEMILNACSKLNSYVDIKGLFINLMEKLAKFVTDNSGESASEEDKELVKSAIAVYPIMLQYFDRLQNESYMLGFNMDVLKLLDLNTAFMKFSIKCVEKSLLQSINHILSCTIQCLRQYNQRLTNDGIKKLSRLLMASLESNHSIFDIGDFDGLMIFLDYTLRKNIALKVIKSLYKENALEKLDNVEKIQKLIKYIRPLLIDSEDTVEEDSYTFESEQNEVSKMLYVVTSPQPEVIYTIYSELKNIFVAGGPKRRKITLPTLATSLISYCHKICLAYDCKNGIISPELRKSPKLKEDVKNIDLSQVDGTETFYKLMLGIYKLLNEVLTMIAQENPETAFRLFLTSAAQINSLQSDRKSFEEVCASFLNGTLSIFQEAKFDPNKKYSLLLEIIGNLLSYTILSDENVENIIKIIEESCNNLTKRGEQFNIMLCIAQIYYLNLKNGNKAIEYIAKAKKYAEYALTNPQNLILFVEFLNKLLYFVEIGDESLDIKPQNINEIIELIKMYIQTIKNEVRVDSTFLPDIEKYFMNTIEVIQKRKFAQNHKPIYDSILC